jgi:hypothetical protein
MMWSWTILKLKVVTSSRHIAKFHERQYLSFWLYIFLFLNLFYKEFKRWHEWLKTEEGQYKVKEAVSFPFEGCQNFFV